MSFNNGEGVETGDVSFSRSVVASLNDFRSGWVTDGAGNHYASALYPASGEGIFAWATEGGLDSSDTWWLDDLENSGEDKYRLDRGNSAFIVTGGSLSIDSVAVPTPSAALAGISLLGITALKRRRALA